MLTADPVAEGVRPFFNSLLRGWDRPTDVVRKNPDDPDDAEGRKRL